MASIVSKDGPVAGVSISWGPTEGERVAGPGVVVPELKPDGAEDEAIGLPKVWSGGSGALRAPLRCRSTMGGARPFAGRSSRLSAWSSSRAARAGATQRPPLRAGPGAMPMIWLGGIWGISLLSVQVVPFLGDRVQII